MAELAIEIESCGGLWAGPVSSEEEFNKIKKSLEELEEVSHVLYSPGIKQIAVWYSDGHRKEETHNIVCDHLQEEFNFVIKITPS